MSKCAMCLGPTSECGHSPAPSSPSSALTAPTSHQELVEKARKFVHAMDRKPQSSGPTRAATWMLEYATGDTRMDIYELLVAFVESIEWAGAESGAPLEQTDETRALREALEDWAYQYPDQHLLREYANLFPSKEIK